jgi:hypothetical protein
LAELRDRVAAPDLRRGASVVPVVREIVADVGALHREPANAGTLFQVASQFNTLEMIDPSVTPEDGIDRYERDHTQGPACAIACGAGTIYRNYLVPLDGGIGQSRSRQVDCLADLAAALGIAVGMRNGYALATGGQLDEVRAALAGLDGAARDRVAGRLRIGVQWDTEVTAGDTGHLVTQAYCSALPIAYSGLDAERSEPFARLVLDAAYEATLAAAVLNARRTGHRTAHLTLLGGGAFGNPTGWILDALDRAVGRVAGTDLDVAVVSYGSPSRALAERTERRRA